MKRRILVAVVAWRQWRILRPLLLEAAILTSLATHAIATTVTTVDRNGNVLSSFPVYLGPDPIYNFVRADDDGNIWVGRMSFSYFFGGFNPYDAAVKFSPTGERLLTVKGPMRQPQGGIAFDDAGNIYVPGIQDGGPLSDKFMYKFDSTGAYLSSFPLQGDQQIDLALHDGNLYLTSQFGGLNRYTLEGTSLPGGIGDETTLAIDPDGMSIWATATVRFTIDQVLRRFDREMNLLSTLPLPRTPIIGGLEVLPDGTLAFMTLGNSLKLYSRDGHELAHLDFAFLRPNERWVVYSADHHGNFHILHGVDIPEPSTWLLAILGAAWLVLCKLARGRTAARAGKPNRSCILMTDTI